MKFETIVAAALLSTLILPAAAEARPDTRSMTCQQLLGLLQNQGAVVMNTGTHTYKRFVYHRGYCDFGETVQTAWVDASDGECRLRECRPPRVDRDSGGR